MLPYLLAVAVACGIHRLWNYEDIFRGVRGVLIRLRAKALQPRQGCVSKLVRPLGWLLLPVICPACNAFWAGVVAAASAYLMGVLPLWQAVSLPFAAYPLLRALVWAYAQPVESLWAQMSPPEVQAPATVAPKPPAPAASAGCGGGCGQSAAASQQLVSDMLAEQAAARKYRQRVVLMTALADFDPSYSLVSVIFDQARALARDPQRLVQVWVMASARLDRLPPGLPANVRVMPYIPDTPWVSDVVDAAAVGRIQQALIARLLALGNATVITHDLLLVSQYVNFATAIHQVGKIKAFAWIHQIHSCVGARPAMTVRASLPPGHFLAVVNETGVDSAADYYQCDPARVLVLPNSRDIATWGTTAAAEKILGAANPLAADFAQVLPLSMPRANAKGLDHVLRTHAALRALGRSTSLIVADAHCTTAAVIKMKGAYKDQAKALGVDVVFVSDILPDRANVGADAATIRALFDATNVFVFPSVSESSGLVALEALVTGNTLWVNSNVPALHQLVAVTGAGAGAYEWPFPSGTVAGVSVDYEALAKAITLVEDERPWRRHHRNVVLDLTVAGLAGALDHALSAAAPVP